MNFALVLAALPFGTPIDRPPERYYLVLYGAESAPFRTRLTHTFATFVKTTPADDGSLRVEAHTVSWMPATLEIRPLAIRPEPGVNLTLAETFRWIDSFDGRVSMWGPYEIDDSMYEPTLARKAELEAGRIDYRALGGLPRDSEISNCGQSFTRASPRVGRRFQPTPAPGERGTSVLAGRYVRAGTITDPEETHDWLLPVIGVDVNRVTRREPGERISPWREEWAKRRGPG